MALTETWSDRFALRDDGVPKERYTSAEFAALEAERLWPKVWQMACRSEEIPEPGDYAVYDILDQSVLLMRQEDGTVQAFHNVCPHRGTQLADGTGSLPSSRLVCPFHGWSWSPDGANTFVLDADEFCGGRPTQDRVGLRTVRSAEWLACVWINLDPDAAPFEDHIASIRGYVEPLLIERMRVYWWNRTVLPANWKIAQEAFLEGYHTPGTHPQLGQFQPDGTMVHQGLRYDVYDGGHSTFRQGREIPATATRAGTAAATRRAPIRRPPPASSSSSCRSSTRAWTPWCWRTTSTSPARWQAGPSPRVRAPPPSSWRRSTPGPPSGARSCRRRSRSCSGAGAARRSSSRTRSSCRSSPTRSATVAQRRRPRLVHLRGLVAHHPLRGTGAPPARSCARRPPRSRGLAQIPLQDFSNIPRIQRGLHSHGFDATILADHQERSILHAHRELDRYVRT